MAKFEVGYKAEDGKNYRFTFKSDRQLAYHRNWAYFIGMPLWIELCAAQRRIEAREDSVMHRVGYREPLYIKNLDTKYSVSFA